MEYDGIIFDCDGVLAKPTSSKVMEAAVTQAFESVGISAPDSLDVKNFIEPTVDCLDELHEKYGIDRTEFWLHREKAAIHHQYQEIQNGRKRPYQDIHILEKISVPTAVVSNNQRQTVGNFLNEYDLLEHIDAYFGREIDLQALYRIKPGTFYIDKTIEELHLDNPLMVGDSQTDLDAAFNAGIDSAFLNRDRKDSHGLKTNPTYSIYSLETLPSILSEK